jgi:xanthine dehydrogenase/oxidase
MQSQIFVSSKIQHAGQPIGLILAKTRDIAVAAAAKVRVTYSNVQPPILNIKQSIEKAKKEGTLESLIVSTTKSPKENARDGKYRIKGEFEIGGQAHFQMEPNTCLCIPTEEGMSVYSSTQWIDKTQALIASALCIPVNK